MNRNSLLILAVIATGGLFLLALYLRDKRNKQEQTEITVNTQGTKFTPSVGEKITNAYNKSMSTITPEDSAIVTKYAGWLDLADNLSAKYKSNTIDSRQSAELNQIEKNLSTVSALPDDIFSLVVSKWMKARKYSSYKGSKLYNSQVFLVPSKQTFFNKCKKLNVK